MRKKYEAKHCQVQRSVELKEPEERFVNHFKPL